MWKREKITSLLLKKNFLISSWRKSRRPENVDKALMNSLGGKNKLNYRIYVQYIYLIYVSRTRRWRQKVFFFFFLIWSSVWFLLCARMTHVKLMIWSIFEARVETKCFRYFELWLLDENSTFFSFFQIISIRRFFSNVNNFLGKRTISNNPCVI